MMLRTKRRKKLTCNAVRKGSVDPTRTVALRRAHIADLRRRFTALKVRIIRLVVDEDAFGLKDRKPFVPVTNVTASLLDDSRTLSWDERQAVVFNKFCATGEGGGIDPSCGKDDAATTTGVMAKLKQLGADAKHLEHMAKDAVLKRVFTNIAALPEPYQSAALKSISLVTAGTQVAFAAWTASQALAEKVAIERGNTPEQAAKLRGVMAAADIGLFKPVAFATAFDPTGISATASWIIPPATGAYLAVAAVTSPLKTLTAAGKLVKEALRTAGQKIGEWAGAAHNEEASTVNLIADALDDADYEDEYVALLVAALGELPAADAVRLADRLYAQKPTTNRGAFQFYADPEKVKAFQRWLKSHVTTYITSDTEAELWRKYTEQGYKKGAGRAFDDTRASLRARAADRAQMDHFAGARDEFLRGAFGQPETVEKIQLLAGRSFDDLKNITEDMSTRMSRTLVDGLVQGQNPREIARELADDLDLSRERSLMIARTEIIRAHAEGQLDAMELLGVEEVGVEVELSTARDDRVCVECASMEGDIYSVEDAHGIIPVHPNCRCAFLPRIPQDKPDKRLSWR